MKIALKIIIGIVAFLIIVVGIGFILPAKYEVVRTINTTASPDKIYAQIGDLKNWKDWGPWYENDKTIKSTFSENTSSVGSFSQWTSEQDGPGKMTFNTVKNNEYLEYDLEFIDMQMKSKGSFTLEKDAAGTKITWKMWGDYGMNPISRYFGLFMDGMLGKDFEKGLANLKKNGEK